MPQGCECHLAGIKLSWWLATIGSSADSQQPFFFVFFSNFTTQLAFLTFGVE